MNDRPCGPSSWKGRIPFIFRIGVPQFCFESACRWHDQMYERGGTPDTRLEVDELFYWMLKNRISGKYTMNYRPLSALRRGWLYFWAWVYYRAVRQYGDKHFNYRLEVSDE